MGNGQSTDSLGPTQLNLISESLARQGHQDLVVSTPSGEHHRLRQDARQEIRSQLFGGSDTDESTSHSSIDIPTMAQPTPKLDIAAIVAVIEDLKKHASPQDLIILHKAILSATQDNVPTSPSVESEKKMSRRRSFFTPGIATRDKKSKKTPTKKEQTQTWSPEMFGTSPLSRLERMSPTYDPFVAQNIDRSLSPDLSYLGDYKLGSLRVTNGAATPEPSICGDRPATSGGLSSKSSREDNYYTASEASGRDSPQKHPTIDAIMRQDAWRSDDCETPRQSTMPIPVVHVQDVEQEMDVSFASSVQSGLSAVSYNERSDVEDSSNDDGLRVDFSPLERPLSALKLYTFEASSNPFLVLNDDDQYDGVTPSPPIEASLCESLPASEVDDSYFPMPVTYRDTSESDTESLRIPLKCPTRAPPPPPSNEDNADDEDADEYEDEDYFGEGAIPEQESRPSPGLEVTSKSEYEESVYSEYIMSPVAPPNVQPSRMYGSVMSASSSIYSSQPQSFAVDDHQSEKQRSRLDSGYGSQSSVRSLKLGGEDRRLEDVLESPDQVMHEGDSGIAAIATGAPISQNEEPMNSSDAPYKAYSHERFGYKRSGEFDAQFPSIPPRSPSRPRPEHRLSTPNLQKTSTFMPSPVTEAKLNFTSNPAGTPDANQTTPKKLQKRRPLSEQAITAPRPAALVFQAGVFESTAFDNLPRVPSLITNRHRNRLSRTPGMEHLEQTFQSVSHSSHSHNAGSPEIPIVPIRFPSPTRKHLPTKEIRNSAPTTPTQERGRKARKSESATERPSLNFFRRSRSRKSQERVRSLSLSPEAPDTLMDFAGLTDFGTVAASLGSSPYDLASSVAAPRRDTQSEAKETGPVLQPYQLGASAPKKKSGMDDKEAARLAVERSRDLADGLELNSIQSLQRPTFS